MCLFQELQTRVGLEMPTWQVHGCTFRVRHGGSGWGILHSSQHPSPAHGGFLEACQVETAWLPLTQDRGSVGVGLRQCLGEGWVSVHPDTVSPS